MENLLSSALKPESVALDRIRDRPVPRLESRTDRAFDRHLDDIDRDRSEPRRAERDQPERRQVTEPSAPDRQQNRNQTVNRDEDQRAAGSETGRSVDRSNRSDIDRGASEPDDTSQQGTDGTVTSSDAVSPEAASPEAASPVAASPEAAPENNDTSAATLGEKAAEIPNSEPAVMVGAPPSEADLGAIVQQETTTPQSEAGPDPVFLLEDAAVSGGPAAQNETGSLVAALDPTGDTPDASGNQPAPAINAPAIPSSDPDDTATAPLNNLAGEPAVAAAAALPATAEATAPRARIQPKTPAAASAVGNGLPANAAGQAPAATGNLPLTPGLTSSLADPAGATADEPLPASGQSDGEEAPPPRFADALKAAERPDKAQIARAALNFANAKPQIETGPSVQAPAAASLDSLFSDALSPNATSWGLPGSTGDSVATLRFTSIARTAQVTNVPVNTLAFHVARQFDNGVNRFQIKLDPPELGRLDVKMEMNADGGVKLHLTVERPEALDFLQRDARALEKALADAGLETDGDSLSFSLEDQDGQFSNGEDSDAPHDDAPEHLANEDGPAATLMSSYVSSTGVDIHI